MGPAIVARAAAAVATLVAVILMPAHADELHVDFSAGTRLEFNDNPRLVAGDVDTVTGVIADAGLDVRWGEEDWSLHFTPRFVGRRYTGDYELDSRDLSLDAGYARTFERNSIATSLGYQRASTLTGAFAATGATEDNVPSETLYARVALGHSASQRLSLNADLTYQDVAYIGGLRYGLRDYNYLSALTYTRYAVSERSSASIVARIGSLDIPVTGAGSREITVGLGFDHAWSERWQMDLYAGPTFSDFNDGPATTGYSYRTGLKGAWQRTQVNVQASRLLSPDAGQGRLQIREDYRASVSHSLRESLDASVFAASESYADTGRRADISGFQSGTERVGASLSWRPLDRWSFGATIEHTVRDAPGNPTGNLLSMAVTWNGRPLSLSL